VQVTLGISVDGEGTVRSTPAGIECRRSCSARFDRGSRVLLVAQPDPGRRFAGWSGACSGTGDCLLDLGGDASAGARFEPDSPPPPPPKPRFHLSVVMAGTGSGRVTSTPPGVDCPATCVADFDLGSSVMLAQSPAAGSRFSGWSGACSGAAGCTVAI